MSKKILVISTSPRKTEIPTLLADEFVRGAQEAGHQVEKISLYDKTISFCRGCLSCLNTQRCVIHDDADTIAQKMKTADSIVFATPSITVNVRPDENHADRATPFILLSTSSGNLYLLACAAEDEPLP